MNAILNHPSAPPSQAAPRPAPARPVKLEVNRTGFWHTVATFDASDAPAEFVMREAVEMLCVLDPSATFRVMPADRSLGALLTYSLTTGWVTK